MSEVKKETRGRKPIPEGATKIKNGIEYIRVGKKWVKNSSYEQKTNEAQATGDNETETDSGADRSQLHVSGQPAGSAPGAEQEAGEVGDIFADDWAEAAQNFHEHEGEATGDQEADEMNVNIEGEQLLAIMDIIGSRLILLLQKTWKGKQPKEDFELSDKEKEELKEFADKAAAKLNVVKTDNPWVALGLSYALITGLKIKI